MKTASAFLVIDVQQGLCFGTGAAYDAKQLIRRINVVSNKARAAGSKVIFVQHETLCAPLSYGGAFWRLADGLETSDADLSIRKTASDSFHQTALSAVLKAMAVDRLVVTGLQSEFCVDSTVRRALALGFDVDLISDGHSTVDSEVLSAKDIIAHHNHTLANLGSYGPRVRLHSAETVSFDA